MKDNPKRLQIAQFGKAYNSAQPPLTVEEIEKAIAHRLEIINTEFAKGFDLIKKYRRSVSFFGSARFDETSEYYLKAQSLAHRIVTELGYTIVTGGGPGIMEGASRGAYEARGNSIGFTIKLPNEQSINTFLTDYREFRFFFTRKVMLSFSAEAYIFFPGGFGTLDEFFEIVTLVQTRKIPPVPIIVVGKDFWEPLDTFIKQNLLERHATIDPEDRSIYRICDNEDEAFSIIKNAPLRRE